MTAGKLAPGTLDASAETHSIRAAATALATALLALNVLDIMVTELAIRYLGAIEVNPLMAPLIGTAWAPGLKILVPLAIVVMATRARSWQVVTALRIVVGIYMVIAIIGVGQVAWVLA